MALGLGILVVADVHPEAQTMSRISIHRQSVWAGWSAHPYGLVSEVRGTWTVPEVQCSDALGFHEWLQSRVAPWVGIWGQGGPTFKTGTWLAQVATVSECRQGQVYRYQAAWQFYHASDSGDDTSQAPTYLFDVEPGDTIQAAVFYQGQQSDGRLKFSANIKDVTAQNRGASWYSQQVTMYSAPWVYPENAAWQGGCIVEDLPKAQLRYVQYIRAYAEGYGLAKFTTPISFGWPGCTVDQRGVGSYSGYDTLSRWDMKMPVTQHHKRRWRTLAQTGSPYGSDSGEFSVTWVNWR